MSSNTLTFSGDASADSAVIPVHVPDVETRSSPQECRPLAEIELYDYKSDEMGRLPRVYTSDVQKQGLGIKMYNDESLELIDISISDEGMQWIM